MRPRCVRAQICAPGFAYGFLRRVVSQSIALRLEERGGTLSHRAATTARIGGAAPAAQRSAVSGLVFFKRKSEARLHQPSQTCALHVTVRVRWARALACVVMC
jgi:hypothetical protein